jgi:hypothetical protein
MDIAEAIYGNKRAAAEHDGKRESENSSSSSSSGSGGGGGGAVLPPSSLKGQQQLQSQSRRLGHGVFDGPLRSALLRGMFADKSHGGGSGGSGGGVAHPHVPAPISAGVDDVDDYSIPKAPLSADGLASLLCPPFAAAGPLLLRRLGGVRGGVGSGEDGVGAEIAQGYADEEDEEAAGGGSGVGFGDEDGLSHTPSSSSSSSSRLSLYRKQQALNKGSLLSLDLSFNGFGYRFGEALVRALQTEFAPKDLDADEALRRAKEAKKNRNKNKNGEGVAPLSSSSFAQKWRPVRWRRRSPVSQLILCSSHIRKRDAAALVEVNNKSKPLVSHHPHHYHH